MQLLCIYCEKTCKSDNSLRNHERLCKSNPNRQFTVFSDPKFQKINPGRGSNQFTLAKKEGRTVEISETTREKFRVLLKSRSAEFNAETAKKISKTILEKAARGEWHTSVAKKMHHSFNGIDLHGSWEYKYALYLENNKIKWERCKESFKYFFQDKWRTYTPDFYLSETDEYVEIKGYKTKKDDAKWSQFPSHRTLKILMKKELIDLNII